MFTSEKYHSVIYLIFDVKIGAGLAEDLHNTREAVPHSNVETGLLVLRVDKQKKPELEPHHEPRIVKEGHSVVVVGMWRPDSWC